MNVKRDARSVAAALRRLAAPGATLRPDGEGYSVFSPGAGRVGARVRASQVRALHSQGTIAPALEDGAYEMTAAGQSLLRRSAAASADAFLAQHGALETRSVIDDAGTVGSAQALADSVLRRFIGLKTATGAPWLSARELAAAEALRTLMLAGQRGLSRGVDWSAPGRQAGCGDGGGVEAAMAAGCDARARAERALRQLAPPLRRVIEQALMHDAGIEAIERAAHWPARSGKLALKLALAQLAANGV